MTIAELDEMKREELDKLKALYNFLVDNHMNLEACSCCFAITVYWEGKEIANDIENISDLKNLIETVEKRLNA